jgi:hypothetical protein
MYRYYKQSYQDVVKKSTSKGMSIDDGKIISPRGYPIWIENALASVGITLD